MAARRKASVNHSLLRWTRFLVAVLAILIAAAHLPSASFSGSGQSGSGGPSSFQAANQIGAGQQYSAPLFGPQAMGFWFDIEIVAYAVIAVVFLLGLRTWYVPAVLFNAFNVGIYFLSGFTAIPGITMMAFGNRLGGLGHSLTTSVLIISWLAVLVLGLALLRYDPGSDLDRFAATTRTDRVSEF